ncbi:NNP-1 Nop52 [Cryptosporidium sp. chipmunk genotype I]|uniref:NNP-1 Nop52 n=1 Tax=Cryptosporidium sp. chipmunk genotype I TaxID=1280935 RepID=UPI00351AAB66|nr:NNP-1 Nop52 [Cryptosporidium sp. chipmunk genotype I]
MKGNSKNENELLIRLSKTLTSVSPANRKKGLDIITRYISKHNNSMTRLQMLKIWKGLYYSMWLSDKVLIQREIAVSISRLQKRFDVKENLFSFIEEFYLMMRFRWDGMDHYRMDKFVFLQRTMLAESLDILSKKNFDPEFAKGLFSVYRNCLFVEDTANENSMGKKRKFSMVYRQIDNDNETDSSNNLFLGRSTGIGISLIFCKQFPQEFVYLLYEQYKLIKENSSNKNLLNEYISTFFTEYSEFIISIIKSCTAHSTLTENIYSQLILKLFDFDLLLDQVICDIEDLNIDQEERNLISSFLSENIVSFMSILHSSLLNISKSNDNSITQSKRNNIYSTLEKIGVFLKNNLISSNNLPKVSKNKKRISTNKLGNVSYEINHEDKEKRVRFDMSKNVRMLLPDSISTSRALLKIFDKKNDMKGNNEINCILFRPSSNSDLQNDDPGISESDSYKNYNLNSLKNIEIVSAEKALSKPSESNSSPSKSILKRRGINI